MKKTYKDRFITESEKAYYLIRLLVILLLSSLFLNGVSSFSRSINTYRNLSLQRIASNRLRLLNSLEKGNNIIDSQNFCKDSLRFKNFSLRSCEATDFRKQIYFIKEDSYEDLKQ